MADPNTAAPVIVWFRKDLRLRDNAALTAAAESGRPIIPVYIRELEAPDIGPLGAAQAWWLHHSLVALKADLKSLESDLVLASGPAADVLLELCEKSGADKVYFNRRYERDEMDRDIARELKRGHVAIEVFHGQLLHEPKTIRTGSGNAYRVYTPFWNAVEKKGDPSEPLHDAPKRLESPDSMPRSEPIDSWELLPKKPNWARHFDEIWMPGEQGASDKLKHFIDADLADYKRGRDMPSLNVTSFLSPHLALGEISPARIWHVSKQPKPSENVTHFRKELTWRDFCYTLLVEFPELGTKNWDKKFDAFEWQFDQGDFDAWTRGETGYPIVDAGMRQLWRHGIMHNRVRMITASFLIKDLMIDWRKGEAWFRDTLVDADPASNTANWQWVAGSGADASPFFRIFNPILQGEKFDGDGDYVREYVPELAKLERKYIHKPFEAPQHVLEKAGITLGKTYPKPIVNHGKARDRALAAYKALRA